jgi:hypothetical protein
MKFFASSFRRNKDICQKKEIEKFLLENNKTNDDEKIRLQN